MIGLIHLPQAHQQHHPHKSRSHTSALQQCQNVSIWQLDSAAIKASSGSTTLLPKTAVAQREEASRARSDTTIELPRMTATVLVVTKGFIIIRRPNESPHYIQACNPLPLSIEFIKWWFSSDLELFGDLYGVIDTIIQSPTSPISKGFTFQTTDGKSAFIGVWTALMIGIDTAVWTEVMFAVLVLIGKSLRCSAPFKALLPSLTEPTIISWATDRAITTASFSIPLGRLSSIRLAPQWQVALWKVGLTVLPTTFIFLSQSSLYCAS